MNETLLIQVKLSFPKIYKLKNIYNCICMTSLLPVGRCINMDPSLTYLVTSQTQFIRFGQFFWLNL